MPGKARTHPSLSRGTTPTLITILIVLFITALLYLPGLNSGFFLDDIPNLKNLQTDSMVSGLETFTLSGNAGRSGRPLSLLSFYLQREHFPGNPFALKAVNLSIHLINGIAVFFITYLLLTLTKYGDKNKRLIAILTTSLWLLAPIQSTTLLYTIQRMTQLSASFVFFGYMTYLYQKHLLSRCEISQIKYIARLTITIAIFTPLGVLCKENAIVLPGLILVTEWLLPSREIKGNRYRAILFFIITLPIFITVSYLLLTLNSTLAGYNYRDFTLGERLTTEINIIIEYTFKIIIPIHGNYSIFHDSYPISENIFSSQKSIASTTIFLLLLAIIPFLKHRLPLAAIGISFFLIGHVIESTYIPLELYFEHRNYLPSFGIFLAASILLTTLSDRFNKKVIFFLIFAYISIHSLVLSLETRMWGLPLKQATTWLKKQPNSKRTIMMMASTHMQFKNYQSAVPYYQALKRLDPDNPYSDLITIRIYACNLGTQPPEKYWANFEKLIEKSSVSNDLAQELEIITGLIQNNSCSRLDIQRLTQSTETLAKKNINTINGVAFLGYIANLYASIGDYNAAIKIHYLHYEKTNDIGILFKPAKLFLDQGKFNESLAIIEYIDKIASNNIESELKYRNQISSWRTTINTKISGSDAEH